MGNVMIGKERGLGDQGELNCVIYVSRSRTRIDRVASMLVPGYSTLYRSFFSTCPCRTRTVPRDRVRIPLVVETFSLSILGCRNSILD